MASAQGWAVLICSPKSRIEQRNPPASSCMVRSGRLNKTVERCLLVMDKYVTHQTPMIRRWLAKRPRRHVHLTPARHGSTKSSASSRSSPMKMIRRGVYRRVAALRADVASFIERHNANPRPFRWTSASPTALGLLASDQCRQVHMSAAPELHGFRGGAPSTA